VCTSVDECVSEWDCGSAVDGGEDAIHFCSEGNLYAIVDDGGGGGVGAEVGAVRGFLEFLVYGRERVCREDCGEACVSP
jgi:hypothetical protein